MILTLNEELKETRYKPKPKNELIAKLEDNKKEYNKIGKSYDYETIDIKSLYYAQDNIAGEFAHKNYIDYLLAAWDSHWGIVITPNIIWYTLQCELTSIVSENVDLYRNLFTTSDEKQVISVQTNDPVVLPLNSIIYALSELVPSDIKAFLPVFSTSSDRAILAHYAAFADMVSPYYTYMMYSCGFPAIDVRGEVEDWNKLRDAWKTIGKLFTKHQEYIARVDGMLEEICQSLENKDFWKDMFSLDKCGSGHQYYVRGWLTKLFDKEPRVKFPENYPSHISIVNYRNITAKKDYQMKQGLFSSNKENRFLVPDFAHIVYEKKPEVRTTRSK